MGKSRTEKYLDIPRIQASGETSLLLHSNLPSWITPEINFLGVCSHLIRRHHLYFWRRVTSFTRIRSLSPLRIMDQIFLPYITCMKYIGPRRLNNWRPESLYQHWADRDFTSWHLAWYEVIWNLIIIPETMEMWEAGAGGRVQIFPQPGVFAAWSSSPPSLPSVPVTSWAWGCKIINIFNLTFNPQLHIFKAVVLKLFVCRLKSFCMFKQANKLCYLSEPSCDYK